MDTQHRPLPIFGEKFPTYDIKNDNVIRREVVPL